eukprot:4156735-Prymnesium_polylepis.2
MLPVGAKEPGAVSVHSTALVRSIELLNLPASHGNGVAAPRLQYEPAVHLLHTVSPSASWCLPSSHATHLPNPFEGAIVPEEHAVC